MQFEAEVNAFLANAAERGLRIIMVGGAAVNHHGYKRHSADVDLWIEPAKENFEKLLIVLQDLGYEVDELPAKVTLAEQNITIKISPSQEIELITRFIEGASGVEPCDQFDLLCGRYLDTDVLFGRLHPFGQFAHLISEFCQHAHQLLEVLLVRFDPKVDVRGVALVAVVVHCGTTDHDDAQTVFSRARQERVDLSFELHGERDE